MSKKFFSVPHLFGISMLTLTVALAACNKPAAPDVTASGAALDPGSAALPPLPDVQPMVAGPAAPLRRAPAAAALPRARTLGYASPSDHDRYAWIDRANRINDTIGDAPPDYGFDYEDGVSPYGWETAGGYRTYAEPVDGGYRTYYYDPGADEPYLVRDPSYSYGYSGGRVVTVYDRSGRVLDAIQAQRQTDYASRYYERARSMRAAANARQRRGVVASGWADHREVISTQRAEWNRTQQNNPDWRAYRGDQRADNQQLADERAARAQAARQFATWQSQSFRGQAPALYDQPRGGRADGNGDRVRQQIQARQVQVQQAQIRQAQIRQAQQTQQAQAQQAQTQQAQAQRAQQVQQVQAQQAQVRQAQVRQAQVQQAQAQTQQVQAQQLSQQRARQQQVQQQQAQQAQAQHVKAQQQSQQRVREHQVQQQQAQKAKAQQQAQQQRAQQQQVQQQQVQQQQAVAVRAQQQQRVAAQSEQARAALQSQMAARQQGLAADAERGRVARERQAVASQQAAQQRVAAQRQQAQAAAAQRAAIPRPNPARLVSPVVAPPKPPEQPRPQRQPQPQPQPQPQHVTPQRPAPNSGPRGEHDKEHARPNPG